jgi:hypothetical protein
MGTRVYNPSPFVIRGGQDAEVTELLDENPATQQLGKEVLAQCPFSIESIDCFRLLKEKGCAWM